MTKKGRIFAFFLIVLIIAGTIGTTIIDTTKNIRLGLDLQGGFELLYEVKPIEEGQEVDREMLLSTVSALNKRINVLGVNEPRIQIEGENRIRVQLAGVDNQNKARELLSTQAKLTFRDVNDNVLLDGSDLEEGGAAQSFDDQGNPIVTLTLKDADKFGQVTKKIKNMAPNNLLVIWLDFEKGEDSFAEESQKPNPEYLSAATVREVLNTKDVMIEGNFTVESAKNLADLLNAGSLPVELHEIWSDSVGASFGEQAMEKTIFAGIVGIALIFIYMLIFYRFPGVIAVVTLTTYIYLILLVFDWMNGVLTLPGIAALILGVGMAVDANIITYERIKEELKSGKSIMSAFRAGNSRSLATILDANITTILAAVVLFVYGTSSVKGFATMLIISIIVSFLTAVYGSRLLLGLWVNSRFLNKKPGYFGIKQSDIRDLGDVKEGEIIVDGRLKNSDFVKHRKKFFAFSLAFVAIGVILLFTVKLNLGIDFASGTRIEVMANHALTEEEVLKEFNALGIKAEDAVLAGDDNKIGVVRLLGVLNKEEIASVKSHFSEKYGSEPNVSTVSPTVGKELARNAFIAVMIASIGIILYVTLRFEIFFALAAILALLHDAFFIIVMFSITQLEVDLTFIAAILTIVGYSINDTIVTFDRIRENLKIKQKVKTFGDLAEVVNKSLIQTMTRSINTVLTVVFAAAALWILGSEAIRNFSFALLIGLIAGTYSSLFLAAQLWLVWKGKNIGKNPQKPDTKEEPEPEV